MLFKYFLSLYFCIIYLLVSSVTKLHLLYTVVHFMLIIYIYRFVTSLYIYKELLMLYLDFIFTIIVPTLFIYVV